MRRRVEREQSNGVLVAAARGGCLRIAHFGVPGACSRFLALSVWLSPR